MRRATARHRSGALAPTHNPLDNRLAELSLNEDRKQQQAEAGFEALSFFVYRSVLEANINNPEALRNQIKATFVNHPNGTTSVAGLGDLRQQVPFALLAECEQLEPVIRRWWRPSPPELMRAAHLGNWESAAACLQLESSIHPAASG